jgi:hypothetical protein
MSSAPLLAPTSAVGIVIKSGAPAPKPVRFWAYLWAADEEAADDHWRGPADHWAARNAPGPRSGGVCISGVALAPTL